MISLVGRSRRLLNNGIIVIQAHLTRCKLSKFKKELCSDYLSLSDRSVKVTVSLTSMPDRMKYLHLTLYSLLRQSFKPDRVVLWLAENQFPSRENEIPGAVLSLKKYGLEIRWYHDIKSYKKLIPGLKTFPDDIIVTADDDVFYDKEWLAKLYEGYIESPDCISFHRGARISFDQNGVMKPYVDWQEATPEHKESYLNFFTGVGGVLYPPGSLDPEVVDENKFMELCPSGDDIWFWAMAVKNGTKIKVVKNNITLTIDTCPERQFFKQRNTLFLVNCLEGKNDQMIENVIKRYKLENKLKVQ